jgi:hypothetical protein
MMDDRGRKVMCGIFKRSLGMVKFIVIEYSHRHL